MSGGTTAPVARDSQGSGCFGLADFEDIFVIVGVFRSDFVDGIDILFEEFGHASLAVERVEHVLTGFDDSLDEFDCIVVGVAVCFIFVEFDGGEFFLCVDLVQTSDAPDFVTHVDAGWYKVERWCLCWMIKKS